MALNDKQKRAATAITRGLKEKKGLSIKQSELLQEIDDCKKRQKKALEIKEANAKSPVVVEKADETYRKLQNIIDDINEYMSILHPEGLLDYGSGASGGKVMGQG
jgi:hypothetical protein